MRIRALTVAPLVLLALAGCAPGTAPAPDRLPANGELAERGPEVVADGAAALLRAGAVVVEGHLTADGADQTVHLALQGSDLTGTVVTGGAAVQIVVTDEDTYAKGPASFWQDAGRPAEVAARLAGRWVAHAGAAVQRLTPLSLVWLADAVRHPSAAIQRGVHAGRVDSGPLTGTPVAVVTLVDGSTLEVAAVGQPYPLVVDDPGGHQGELRLSAFGKTAEVVPPASAVDPAGAA
jgi:hypothetical protein